MTHTPGRLVWYTFILPLSPTTPSPLGTVQHPAAGRYRPSAHYTTLLRATPRRPSERASTISHPGACVQSGCSAHSHGPTARLLGSPMFGVPEQVHQVLSISIRKEGVRQALELGRVDVTHAIRRLLNAGDFESLPTLKGFDKIRSLKQGCMGPHIQPRHTSPQDFYAQGALRQIRLVHIGNLELTACRRRELGGNIHDLMVVKV